MPAENRTYVEDVDRTLYDVHDATDPAGLTPDIVREISAKKDEPAWMLDFRLKALDTYQRMLPPDWGPGLEGLDMDHIVTYVKPNAEQAHAPDARQQRVGVEAFRGEERHIVRGGLAAKAAEQRRFVAERAVTALCKQLNAEG